jgi:hypothetical protein
MSWRYAAPLILSLVVAGCGSGQTADTQAASPLTYAA